MGELNLDPAVGEEVRWGNRPGVFKVVRVRQSGEGHPNPNLLTPLTGDGTVDLQREQGGLIHQGVPWAVLQYVDETRNVRRTIEWMKAQSQDLGFPDYIADYEVTTGDDHAGNPAIFVRFFVDPDYFHHGAWPPSEKKLTELNHFLDEVRTELLSLDPDRWIYVRTGEARRALDAAS